MCLASSGVRSARVTASAAATSSVTRATRCGWTARVRSTAATGRATGTASVSRTARNPGTKRTASVPKETPRTRQYVTS